MKGYKAFNKNLTCRDMQYEIGKEYTFDGEPIPCTQGFHFCKSIADCYRFYDMSKNTRICEIIASGDIKTDDGVKYCTNHIKIVCEVKNPRAKSNLSDNNSGYCNSGYCNSGNCNTGNCNTGNCNTGNWNTGDCNTGDCNTGNRNTGNRNTGNRNTGNWNTGDWNTGDWNIVSFSAGCFNTEEQTITIFDKPSDWTIQDWFDSKARRILNQIPRNVVEWISSSNMTDAEKEEYKSHETTGGYLKVLDESESAQIWWDGLLEDERKVIYEIPNFDKKKFEKCVGVKI